LAGGADPKALAAALVKVLRAPLPAPEELASPDEYLRRPVREPREPRGEEGIWFRMNVGRDGRADPRWVLPFLCRRGGVQRNEIGRIRILGRETQFEVASAAAGRFAAAARRPDADDPHIRVEPLPGGATPAQAPRPPYRDRGERSGPRRGAART
ncbi:DbpA RNA binding domain-containing protein, partial [Teichococcus cervicalis]